jgi:hypothetical protein
MKMKQSILILRALSFCFAAFVCCSATAQVRGGNEAFGNEANAASWTIYDGADGMYYIPGWDLFEAGNPDLFGYLSAQASLDIYANSLASNGAFTGDYSTNQIRGVVCDVFVELAADFAFADVYFVSGGTFYYSLDFSAPGFFAADGWDVIDVYFREEPWFVVVSGSFVEVEVTESLLSNITEIGVRVFATLTSTAGQFVAIDDFALIPELIVPELDVARNGNNFELIFERELGQAYGVMQSADGMATWGDLSGYTGLIGTGSFTVVDPIGTQKFFNVVTEEFYTNLPDVVP